jgi:hypothetical protein
MTNFRALLPAIYWPVCRYIMCAFYEPIAIFFAALAFWAYSSYISLAPRPQLPPRDTRLHSPSSRSRPASSESSASKIADVPDPTFIRLGQPNDEEMVQLFVRSGHPRRMRAYLTGVRDICSPRGPRRILREGRKTLAKLAPVWRCASEYIGVLEALEQVMVERMGKKRRSGEAAG